MADDPVPERPSTSSIDGQIFGSNGGLRADHPLLRRAQDALKAQFQANQSRLQEELREKANALKQAKAKREALGVELYGFQQNLAKLQLSLEQTHQDYQVINRAREQCEEQLRQLRSQLSQDDGDTKGERSRVETFQLELDRLGATLKQVEEYNEAMKGEIAVTRRAAYAAEEAVQKLEKAKMKQDFRIDTLQDNLKGTQQQLSLISAQLEAQKRETRAALETLAEAEAEMENVHFEKKQLVTQWKSSLLAIQKRDEALSAIQDGMREQQQQEMSLALEVEGYKKDVIKEQLKHESLTAVVRKVEGDAMFVQKQIEGAQERQARLQEILTKLAKSLEHTETEVTHVNNEKKALQGEADAVDRAITKVAAESRNIEEEMLSALSDQTTAEKATSKTASDTTDLRKRIRAEELAVVETENELAKLQVDILNTEAHNTRLAETLGLLDEELHDKGHTIEKYELEIKRRNDEIEKKTREIDILNRRCGWRGRSAKRDTLAEIVEAERQIMLWERKIQLGKEMADVLDPNVGQDVVSEMKKEIHRMQLRLGELMRLQEKLVSDMEKALVKREVITVKGRSKAKATTTPMAGSARSSPAVSSISPLTRNQLDKATTDLSRSIKDTEREIHATEHRVTSLQQQRVSVSEAVAAADSACQQLRGSEEAMRLETVSAVNSRYSLLLATARAQRTTKRLEDLESGRYRPVVEDPGQVAAELAKAQDKLGRMVTLLEGLKASAPHLSGEIDKVLCHVADVRA
ncbi:Coiled-coil domain-containing protein 40 [Tetrabaena socialis]|uniref:Coiled-coil domain-containing protein 40 n=1 Tax=Tetrabaena socialis TaxID=47790 RepID=A0A2J7ZYK7_9CHLO|nr:Coiled-coil domain-containing protein 40 [Tetrabaena socialis]|eukprot:PNH05352.1 Coiled-coil domain-containing protein 40 [Tetrabaena socialis]